MTPATPAPEGRRRAVGLATADDRWFTFCAGLGLDAEVVRRVEQRRADGRKATPGLFVGQGVQHFFLGAQRREPAITVQVGDGEPERVGLALVCNTTPWTYLGARPVQPCPEASFETGLDLFGIRRLRTMATLRHLRQILSRDPKLRGRDLLRLHDVPELVLRGDRPLALQVDGDDLGDRTEVVFRAVPRALDVVV